MSHQEYIEDEIKDYVKYIKEHWSDHLDRKWWLIGMTSNDTEFVCINQFHYQIIASEDEKLYPVGIVYSLIELAKLIVSCNEGVEI